MYSKTKYLACFLFLCFLSIYSRSQILNVSGTYSGLINGDSLMATCIGTIDTTGVDSTSNELTVTFFQLSDGFHLMAFSFCFITNVCNVAAIPDTNSKNLFGWTHGNYSFFRVFTWPQLPNDSIVVTGWVSTTGNNMTFSCDLNGSYSGAVDLVSFSDPQLLWSIISGYGIKEQGTAMAFDSIGNSQVVNWRTVYGDSAISQCAFQRGTLNPITFSYAYPLYHANWTGFQHVDSTTHVSAFNYSTVGNTVNFISNNPDAISWQWDFGDGGTSTLPNPQHSYFTPGNYSVCLSAISDYGCTDTLCQDIGIVVVGVQNSIEPNPFRVYPNPANEILLIKIESIKAEAGTISILTPEGKRLKQWNIGPNQKIISCDIHDLSSGVYFVRLEYNGDVFTQKMILN